MPVWLPEKNMNMKKYATLVLLTCLFQAASAQYATTLVVSSNPPATITEWGGKKEILSYIINLQGAQGGQVKIKTEIKLNDGTPVATTDLARATVYTFSSATTIFSATEVIPMDNMIFSGKFKSAIERTGKLLSENYQICVQLVTATDYLPRSEVKCRNFFIAAIQLPIPVMPASEMVLDPIKAQTAITFRWTPLAPPSNTPAHYRVQVFEVSEEQTPMQAFRSNQPLLDKEVVGTTQYIWNPQLALSTDASLSQDKEDSAKWINDAYVFIWTIQTLDAQGRPVGDGNVNGDGRSEPIIFFVDKRPPSLRKSGPPSRVIYLNKNNKGIRN